MSNRSEGSPFGEVTVSSDGIFWPEITAPVYAIDVEDNEFLIDKATIVLDDHTGLLADASFEGLGVRVKLGWGEYFGREIFEGDVTSARAVTNEKVRQVELTALDFTHRMQRRTPEEPRTWEHGEKLTDIVKEIVSREEYDLKAFQIEPPKEIEFTRDKPLRQVNRSDWDFLQDLARRYNCRTFVEFDGIVASNFYFVSIERLAKADPTLSLRCCTGRGGNLSSFNYERNGAGALIELTMASVDAVTGTLVTKSSPPAAPIKPPPAPATDRDPDLSAKRRDALRKLTELSGVAVAKIKPEKVRVAGDVAQPATEGQRVIRDPTRIVGLSGSGVASGNVELRAKNRVTIKGIAPWAEGDWYVTKVNHVYRRQVAGDKVSSSYCMSRTSR